MKIDPLLSLAFAMHSHKGGYALLLGSGASRAAQVLTGWEIVLDLLRKLARLQGEDCEPDPEEWYVATYGKQPDYAELLDSLAHSQADRSGLLRSYFEPTEHDGETAKRPTAVHKAVAELVKAGVVGIILTTNFDRLIESALADAGIAPTVISTADAARGMLPVQHCDCVIVKIHGDYLDPRIRNTPRELAEYDEAINRLLDRILDEYGLVVCGWSGAYDSALRSAIERCASRRFTTYWMGKGKLGEEAAKLVSLRNAECIEIESADKAFAQLAEKIRALEELSQAHPLSVQSAVASLKSYLTDERDRIRVHDLVVSETNRAFEVLASSNLGPQAPYSDEETVRRVRVYDSAMDVVKSLFITGCYWGSEIHHNVWQRVIERLTAFEEYNGVAEWLALRFYPARLLLYAAGLACIAAEKLGTVGFLLTVPEIDHQGNRQPSLRSMFRNDAAWDNLGKQFQRAVQDRTCLAPWSEWFFTSLREPLIEYLPTDMGYDRAFDRFEYILGLAYACLYDGRWGPVGRFGWKLAYRRTDEDVRETVGKELSKAGADWPPLRQGLCDGSLEKLLDCKTNYDDLVEKVGRRR